MSISLDSTTQGEYLVGTTVAARSQAVVAAFTGTVTCKVYDGSDVEKAAATFDAPWASASGATVTIGEVGKLIVSEGGTPDDNWYVEISNGTRWLRGTFGLAGSGKDFTWSASTFEVGQEAELGTVTLTASVPDTTSAPANTDVPVINGTTQVGQVLSVTDGAWTGTPTPTFAYQWIRDGADLTGETASTYTLVSADEGAMMGARVTATNSAGSANASATAVGPVDAPVSALTVSGVPSPIPLYQGGTFSLASYVSGGVTPYTYSYTGTLPTGVTLGASTGVLTATASADIGTSGSIDFQVDDSAAVADLPNFGITSAVGGTNLPFTFGHVFSEGDVPSGYYVESDLTDWQCVPTTYWPDGSLRHAIIAGRATCTANVEKSIALSVSGTNRSGTALTETNLAANLPTTTWSDGTRTITLNSLIGTSALHRTVCTGPVMSNWIYRSQVDGSNHLVIWFDVRLYVGGRTEVYPWAENCYLTVASPTSDTRTHTVTMGGATKFSSSIAIKHHTRIPLISGSAFSYWSGTDPQIVPQHDVAYLRATKMVPNYGWTSPSVTKLNGLQQTYTPNTLAGISSAMGAAGSSAAILNNADALYAASGDARAWRASVAFALSGGSWSIHHRAEASSTQGTGGNPNEPFMFSQYPSASLQIQDTPTIPEGAGATNGTPVVSHQPSYGYLQWLCSGRWWFLEEMLFWVGWNYLYQTVANRVGVSGTGANGVIKTTAGANTDRGGAWGLRTLAQGLVSLPTTHPCYASLKNSWEQNTNWYKALAIDGTVEGGDDVNALGVLGFYGSFAQSVYSTSNSATHMYGAGWMQGMLQGVLGFTWDLSLPQDSASQTRHAAIRDHAYTMVVARTGDGSGNSWRYRNFIVYGLNWGTVGGSYYASWDGAYAIYKAGFGITNDGDGGTSLFSHSSQTVLAPGSSSKPYFGQALTALAYAVDHGKTGASTGWARIEAASNYASYTAAEFNDEPEHGVVPRA